MPAYPVVDNNPPIAPIPEGPVSPRQALLWAQTAIHTLIQWCIQARVAINGAMRGKINAVYEIDGDRDFTLSANAATTTVTDERITPQSWLGFDPLTLNAATELAGGTMYSLEANRLVGSAVVTHANNAQTDRTFRVLIIS